MTREFKKSLILIFDSGIGGLTVLREVRVLLPEYQYIYVADDLGFPYGDWDEAELLEHMVTIFGQYISIYNPELIVIACNTASTLALARLRENYPDVAFVGTVPAIKPAAERTRSGLVSVLATPGTVKRAYTRDLIQSFASQCHVRLVGAERLAKMSEIYMQGGAVCDDELMSEIAHCFIEQNDLRTDIVVLACTHYPFLINRFRQIAPWPVDWLDPAEAIARRALSLIERDGAYLQNSEDDIAIFSSGHVSFEKRKFLHGFGLKVQ